MFTRDVAVLLGVSTVYVQRLAVEDRLPHLVSAEGYVFRADHMRTVARARHVMRSSEPVAALRARDVLT